MSESKTTFDPKRVILPIVRGIFHFVIEGFQTCFRRTQSTEAFPTYVATSPIACSYFVFPLISHQIWCFLIPSCYGEQRTKYNRFLHLSGSRFSLFLFLTPPRSEVFAVAFALLAAGAVILTLNVLLL
ncbi:hypothetical protein H5410_036338, partial [Solanum commersonii]